MPSALTYPGIYVEEIPSGVRTITGVSTSNTAFVDFFARGPLNKAVRVTSQAQFDAVFGGLDARSEGSYAVSQFFLNGGSVAWVVRVAAGTPAEAHIDLKGGSPAATVMTIKASSPGVWARDVVEVAVIDAPNGRFNLFVRRLASATGPPKVLAVEAFRNLSMDPASPDFVADVLGGSELVRAVDVKGTTVPDGSTGTAAGGPADEAAWDPPNGGPLTGGDDGTVPTTAAEVTGTELAQSGMHALDAIAPDIFNLLCLPIAVTMDENNRKALYAAAAPYCVTKRAFLLVDVPSDVDTPAEMVTHYANLDHDDHSAVYFPRLEISDPLNAGRPRNVAASGTMAGVYSRIDATRGVWKAPAGTEAVLRGATLPKVLTDGDNGGLNPLGINALRNFPVFGNVAWGARTLAGADQQASEWKYVPVRRTALFIEESLFQALKWVVFEPNDEPLWAQIRLNVGAFLNDQFRLGAFQGRTPREAYFVKCDHDTTTQNDIDRGVVNIVVGFAPLKPAEFVVLRIQQIAGQVQV
jgi:Bacteriophage tail sheath protein